MKVRSRLFPPGGKEVPGFNARFRCLLFHFGTNKEVANSQWLPIRRKWEMLAWRDLDLGPIFFERGGPTAHIT